MQENGFNPVPAWLKMAYVARLAVVTDIGTHSRPEEMSAHLLLSLSMIEMACERTLVGHLQQDLAVVRREH